MLLFSRTTRLKSVSIRYLLRRALTLEDTYTSATECFFKSLEVYRQLKDYEGLILHRI